MCIFAGIFVDCFALLYTKKGSMDPQGAKCIVRELMCNKDTPIDVEMVLGDGDARLQDAVESEKKTIISDPSLRAEFPHLQLCLPTVNRQFCRTHFCKNLTTKVVRVLKDYKSKHMKGQKMPKGKSLTYIAKYLANAFRQESVKGYP